MPKIIIHHPDGTSAKYGLNGSSFTIGRAVGNDIVLPAGAASSHHAVLKLNGTGDFTVTDLESTNKTKVNGRAIQTSPLQSGDTLVFGDIAADYQSDSSSSGMYSDDQPTQIYEPASHAPARPVVTSPVTATAAPKVVTVVPHVIHRSSYKTARRSTHSSDSGCFALIVFAFVLPASFFIGLVIRHHQDKGEWFWTYLQRHLNG